MKTKQQLHDSLWGRNITKAALFAYLRLMDNASKCGSTAFQFREMYMRRADTIADRFKIRDLVLQWRNAA